MGAYLSEPVTKKISSDEVGKNVACGASSMQGWRINQEDAHNCCLEYDENVSLFAVYDGHGGHEVATYCSQHLPDFIKQTEAYKKGDVKQALIDAFLEFDATLAEPDVVSVLKELAGNGKADKKEDDLNESDDEEENVNSLCMEATMPLEQVMAKYQTDGNPLIKNLKLEKFAGNRACSASPFLRGRRTRDKVGCSSSAAAAGCSSSTTSWNTNEADVSSSSQPCGSTSSANAKDKESDSSGSNEAEQILDSTTSNGSAQISPAVESTEDVTQATKSADMPDSSEDVKDEVVSSPSKSTIQSKSSVNEVEMNGTDAKKDVQVDSNKSGGGGDNVSSSSCTPVENGEAGQQEKISSSECKKTMLVDLYHALLKKNFKDDSDSDEDDDDDDDDENDESFYGIPESDDDTDDVDDDEEEEDESEEEPDLGVDGNENNDDFMVNMEEPGSDSGCTAVVAVLQGNELFVANAGDSRCVLCRDGQAVELSLDHKPEDEPEMERIVKAGGKVTADGRVNGGLNLSRALGDHAYKQNTVLLPEEQMISALPDVRQITIDPKKDEFMVLACDGIWNFMSSQDVINFIRTRIPAYSGNLSKICEELFDHCLAPDTLGDGTGCDNMTAVIVKFKSPSNDNAKAPLVEACVTRKRSVSPSSAPTEENKECRTGEAPINNTCKRPKTEAAI